MRSVPDWGCHALAVLGAVPASRPVGVSGRGRASTIYSGWVLWRRLAALTGGDVPDRNPPNHTQRDGYWQQPPTSPRPSITSSAQIGPSLVAFRPPKVPHREIPAGISELPVVLSYSAGRELGADRGPNLDKRFPNWTCGCDPGPSGRRDHWDPVRACGRYSDTTKSRLLAL